MQGIIFHYFTDASADEPKIDQRFVMCQGALTAAQFEDVILYLKKNYRLLCAEQFLHEVKKGGIDKKTICLTFDDGLKSQYEIAWPVMKKYGLTGMFFVNTCWMEGNKSILEVFHDFRFRMFNDIDQFYLDFFKVLDDSMVLDEEGKIKFKKFEYNSYLPHCTWHSYNDKLFRYTRDQLLTEKQYIDSMFMLMKQKEYEMDKYVDSLWINETEICELRKGGNIIGLHTHDHPTNMRILSYLKKEYEYKKNYEILSSILKEDIETVSYPCGFFDSETNDIMKSLGVKYGFLAHVNDDNNMLRLSRINHPQIIDKMKNEGIS